MLFKNTLFLKKFHGLITIKQFFFFKNNNNSHSLCFLFVLFIFSGYSHKQRNQNKK